MDKHKNNIESYTKKLRLSLPALARKHGTPLFIISRTLLLTQLARFRKLLPRVELFYAVKANPNFEVIKTLAKYGCRFDVASKPEMKCVLSAGVKPEKLIFAHTVKSSEAIQFARRQGVNLMTFDSEYELTKIARYAPGTRVIVRIKVPNVGSVIELSLKFGAEPNYAVPLLLKARKLGLEPIGIAFHVGSQCTYGNNYLEAIELARIILVAAEHKGLNLTVVDIGGGFPISYSDSAEDLFSDIAPAIGLELSRMFKPEIRIIAEPGRVIIGPARSS